MTQAFNLSQLANNLNTSGQLDATDGLTGTIPDSNLPTISASKGGTGQTSLTANNVLLGNGTSAVQFVAPSTSGNILTSNGTTWVSQAPSGGGVTSLNGQTGAITNTNLNSIGSYVLATNSGSAYSYNSTYSPPSLKSINMTASATCPGYTQYVNTTFNNLSGTWRAMSSGDSQGAGLFVRIS